MELFKKTLLSFVILILGVTQYAIADDGDRNDKEEVEQKLLSSSWEDVQVGGYYYYRNIYDSFAYLEDTNGNNIHSRVRNRLNVNIISGMYDGYSASMRIRAQDDHLALYSSQDEIGFNLFVRRAYLTKDFEAGHQVRAGKQYVGTPLEDLTGLGVTSIIKYNDKLVSKLGIFGDTGGDYNENYSRAAAYIPNAYSSSLAYASLEYGDTDDIFYANIWGVYVDTSHLDKNASNSGQNFYGNTFENGDNPGFGLINLGSKINETFSTKFQAILAGSTGYLSESNAVRAGIEVSASVDDFRLDVGFAINGLNGNTSVDTSSAGQLNGLNNVLGEQYVTSSNIDKTNYVWLRFQGDITPKHRIFVATTFINSSLSPTEYGSGVPKTETLAQYSYRLTDKIVISDLMSYSTFDPATGSDKNYEVYNEFQITYYFNKNRM